MKTYGVNWFLVWVALLVYCLPVCGWLRELIYFHSDHSIHSHSAAWVTVSMQALFMSSALTFAWHFTYGRALADAKTVERRRQTLQRSQAFWNRYRWPIWWTIVLAVVASFTLTCKVVFGWPSWLHVVGYSLLLPCTCLASFWLLDKSASKGQLAQLLKLSTGSPEEAP